MDITESPPIYKKCHDACQKCYGASSDNSNTNCKEKKCTLDRSHSKVYGYLEDNERQCYPNVDDQPTYHLVDEDTNKVPVFKKCAEGCKTCNGFTRDDCTSCLNDQNYYEKISDLREEKPQFRCYSHLEQTTPTVRTDEVPNYYVTKDPENPSDPTHYVDKCYDTCSKCSEKGDVTHNKCLDCPTNSYKTVVSGSSGIYNCLEACSNDEKYPKNDPTEGCRPCVSQYEYVEGIFCVNCKAEGKYHIKNEDSCIETTNVGKDKPYENYYPIGDDYGTIEQCYETCETCSAYLDDTSENCLTCQGSKKLLNRNCVEDCGHLYVTDEANNECINCKTKYSPSKYKIYSDDTKCYTQEEFDNIPEQKNLVDEPHNVYSTCGEPCGTCVDIDGTQKCTSCAGHYYMEYDPNRVGSIVNCVEECGNYLYADPYKNECVNCKERTDSFKYFADNKCVNKNISPYLNYYESPDEDKEPFGVIVPCYEKCSKCEKGEEYVGGQVSKMNCDICTSDYYHEVLPSTNCVEHCDIKYGYDDSDINNKWCINCKETISDRGLPMFKYIGDSTSIDNEQCLEDRPKGTYIDDPVYNTLKDCDPSCKNCEGDAFTCTECADGFISNPADNSKCVEECNTQFWYLDDSNNYQCSDECNDNRPYIGGNQCVEECSDEKCVYCEKNAAYVIYDNHCRFRCPKGYVVDSTGKKCVKKELNDDKCNITIYPSRHSTLVSNLKLFAMEWIEEYIFKYDTSLMKHVDVLPAHNMTMQIWKDDECEKEASLMYDITFVNTSDCRAKLEKQYNLPPNGILFVKFDLNRTSLVNQMHYNAYNAFNREKLNLSYCDGGDLIDYSFTEKGANYELAKKLYDKYGVDVFNSSDKFFNDECFHFDDEGKDVPVKERRLHYFQSVPLCEEKCEHVSTDFENGLLRCFCPYSLPTLDEAENITDPKINEANFTKKLSNSNLYLFKCYKSVFSSNIFKNNVGGLTMIALIGMQIPLIINFTLISGFRPIYAFLNQFTRNEFNPPKRNNNFIEDNEIKNESEISDNDYVNSPKNRKDSKNSNVIFSKSFERTQSTFKNTFSSKKSHHKSEKLTMMNSNAIHLQSTNENFMPTSTQYLKKDVIEDKDAEIESFNQDELDELDLLDAIKFDERSFCSFLYRVLKRKIFFLVPFTDITVFEPFTLKLSWFILLISNFFFFDAIFFERKYVQYRYYTLEKINFNYFIKHEIQISLFSSIISSFIGIILSYLFSVKKQFVVCIRTIKDKSLFLLEVKKIMKCYKIKIVIFYIINIIGMLIFWYFCTAFCAIYLKTTKAWFYAFIFTVIFVTVIEFLYSIIISIFRFIGLSCGLSCIYKLSQILF